MELIQVSKEYIGNQGAVNAVNARELHAKLEVKTRFNDWIRRAIDKYGFDENIDYSKMSNANPSIGVEVIVTLDMAKELCMLDDSNKGKQFRRYFIECEKQSQRVLTPSEQIYLLAQGYTQIEQVVSEVKADVETLKNDIVLTSAQKRAIQNAVGAKIASFNPKPENVKKLYSAVWKSVKDRFAVSSYMEIPRLRFDEAIGYVNAIQLDDLV